MPNGCYLPISMFELMDTRVNCFVCVYTDKDTQIGMPV